MLSYALLLLCPLALWSQSVPESDSARTLYRGNCAFCHGMTGGGGRGPALASARLLSGLTDDDLKRIIRGGVPGTSMPPFEVEDNDLDQLVRFVRSLAGSGAPAEKAPGDPAQGRQVYTRNGCAGCHRVGNEGSVFGPELGRVGAGRSLAYIRDSILNPSADIPEDYEGVTVVTRDGRRITGIRVNEDTFTVQLRDASQNLHMFQKKDLRQVILDANEAGSGRLRLS